MTHDEAEDIMNDLAKGWYDADGRVTRVARDYEAVSAEYHKDVGHI